MIRRLNPHGLHVKPTCFFCDEPDLDDPQIVPRGGFDFRVYACTSCATDYPQAYPGTGHGIEAPA